MQSSTDNFATAITGSNVLWAPSIVLADWGVDGYTTTRTPGSTLHVRDLFERTVTSSWGISQSGQVWTNSGGSASDYNVSITTGKGTILHSGANVAKTLTVGQSVLDCDLLAVFETSALAVGAAHSLSLLARYVDANNHLRFTVSFSTTQVVTLAIDSVVGGVVTSLVAATTTDLVHAANKRFTLRVQVCGTLLRARVWSQERDEPGTWSVSTTSSAVTAVGAVGIRTIVNTGGTVPVTFLVDEFRMVNGEIDNISNQVGSIIIDHSLTSDLPQEVSSFIVGVGTTTANVELAYGRGEGTPAGRYFSPFNDESPLIRYPRDTAPVTVDIGAVTDGGIERIRVFTGQSTNTPVRGRRAELSAMSATRLKLSKLIQPPGALSVETGMNVSWLITYLLYRCGLYTSPPPLAACRWWMPLHGSTVPLIPEPTDTFFGMGQMVAYYENSLVDVQISPEFTRDAPYLMAAHGEVNTERTKRLTIDDIALSLTTSAAILDQETNMGRIEFWIRGDSANFNGSPAGSGGIRRIAGIEARDWVTPSIIYLKAGVNATRQIRVELYDGTSTSTLTHSTALPTDGQWHFVGVAWSVSGDKLWVNLDGVVQTSTPSMTTTTLPNISTPLSWESYLPVSDVQLAVDTDAHPDTGGAWANARTWTQEVVYPSALELTALAETEPSEAWALLSRYASAELAVMRTNEFDRFCYLPLGFWSRSAQQTVVDELSTEVDTTDLEISFDPVQIRNRIRVTYTDGSTIFALAGTLAPAFPNNRVPAGASVIFDVNFNVPTVITLNNGFTALDVDLVVSAASLGTPPVMPTDSYVTLMANADATGGYISDGTAFLLSWHPGAAQVAVFNYSSQDAFIVNDVGLPPLAIFGQTAPGTPAYVVRSNQNSINQRGERGLTLNMPGIQRSADAIAVARHLAVLLAQPRPRVERAKVFGDPRRQPGDLVRVADAQNTGATGLWRLTSIRHAKDGPSYVQEVYLAKACEVGRWGDGVSRWGRNTVWTRGED